MEHEFILGSVTLDNAEALIGITAMCNFLASEIELRWYGICDLKKWLLCSKGCIILYIS